MSADLQVELSGFIGNIFPTEIQPQPRRTRGCHLCESTLLALAGLSTMIFTSRRTPVIIKAALVVFEVFLFLVFFFTHHPPPLGFLTHSDIYSKQGLASANQERLADGFN